MIRMKSQLGDSKIILKRSLSYSLLPALLLVFISACDMPAIPFTFRMVLEKS